MKREKLNLFIGVFLITSLTYLIPFVLLAVIQHINILPTNFSFSSSKDIYDVVKEICNDGIITGISSALTFVFFDWLKKVRSLFHTILLIFIGSEIYVISVYLCTFVDYSLSKLNEKSLSEFFLFADSVKYYFLNISLMTAAFSIIIGIFVKKFIVDAKNKQVIS